MGDAEAVLFTWTCYGTWLPGDARGSVDDDHNVYGEPPARPNAGRAGRAQRRMVQPPFALDQAARREVRAAIERLAERRGWSLLAVNVRTNHVHVVAACEPAPAREALSDLKAAATLSLRRAGLVPSSRRLWTEGGSHRYLRDSDSVERAIRYVVEGQGADI